ncbi:MAG: aminotransferase class III-fold pyridoxal phosphate-dependent enzyme [Clostridia bacterium]|nr:aminotransferase class III-fold pyridoxal phosphate-dependent enzyme [Clostridia bacterium]
MLEKNDIKSLDRQFVLPTYARFDAELVGGKGSELVGADGKKYIDMGSGIGVNIFGAADPEWVSAVTAQLGRLQHSSNLYYTSPGVLLAKLLCEKTGFGKVFFSNSGAEANECAVKAARKYAAEKRNIASPVIATLSGSFHGRTLTTLAATGQDKFHKDFQPLTPGFIHIAPNDPEAAASLEKIPDLAAVMFECVQGEGGVIPLEKDFVAALVRLREKTGCLLICDEVQCGNGRTGTLYAYEHFGFMPDVVSTAKGLGGGLPIGATMMTDEVASVFSPGDHGSTFGANPVCCAGALNVISRIDGALLKSVREKSSKIFSALSGARGVKSVSGMGLMIGVETERKASDMLKDCMEGGVLCLTAKTKLRLLPPLNIPDALLDRALGVIIDCCGRGIC